MTLSKNSSDPRPVLRIEDDENDVALFGIALAKIHSSLPLQVICDGARAWEYLSGSGITGRPNKPSLVILDLKLPTSTGMEILLNLKKDPELQRIPVVVLTASRNPEHVAAAYDNGADFYLVKAQRIEQWIEQARAIDAYWRSLAEHPESAGADPSLSLLRNLAELPPSATAGLPVPGS